VKSVIMPWHVTPLLSTFLTAHWCTHQPLFVANS
jgi:hypothetical protein